MMNSGSRWLVAGLAASFLASSLVPPANAETSAIRLAQASPRAGATMDINVFYDQLADHGTWVEHPDYRYVFVPANVGAGWRPYQEGRWVWTDAYGWYWDSDEPFGWATYHYGRWSYDPTYGWFWVPGDTWAPAWVKWRRGGGHTGWAPIAPDRDGFATGRASHYDAPVAESWVFIDDQYMGERDIGIYAAPIPEISVYLRAAPQEYDPIWENGYYVNRGIERRAYDRVVRSRIVSREIVEVDRSDDLFYDDDGGRIGVFAPRIAFGDRFGPPRRVVRTIEPDRRVIVRQYVRDDTPGLFAPSVALLSALDDNRRRELRERRYSERERYQREMQDLQRDRADRIRELRQQADARGDALERERREAIGQRQQRLERFNEERRERGRRVQAPAGAPRGDQPSTQPGGGAPPRQDQQRPDASPQGQQPDQRRPQPQDTQPQGTQQQQDRRRPDTQQRPDQQRPDAGPQGQQPGQRRPQPQDAQPQGTQQQQDRRRPDAQQRPDQQRPDAGPQRQQPDQRRPQPQDAQPQGTQQRPDAGPQRKQPDQRQPQQDTQQPRSQQQPDRRRPDTDQRPDQQRQGGEPQRQQMQQREDQGQRPQQERRRPDQAPKGSDDAPPDPRRQPVPPQ